MAKLVTGNKIPTLMGEDKQKVIEAIHNLDDSLTRMDAERDLMKEILDKMEDDVKFPKKMLRRLARSLHKGDFDDLCNENSDFENLFNELCK